MPDTDGDAPPQGKQPSPPEHSGEDMTVLHERVASLEATQKVEKEAHQREIDALRNDRRTPPPDPGAEARQREEFNKLFLEDPAAAMAKYEQMFTFPNLQKTLQVADSRYAQLQEKLARGERSEILSDNRCSPEVLEEVDMVAKGLTQDERSEKGAYKSILDGVLKRRAWAEMEVNGGQHQNRVRAEHGHLVDEESETHEVELTSEERKWAKKWGMSPNDFKKAQGNHEVEW